ncbi:MAG: NAD-dependent epimerase/dehydratase family protein [Myxococcales bacterium]|nr:MAG: NAD-dependent epimerase/dehydratase family protein [Myxococcales bacterium]
MQGKAIVTGASGFIGSRLRERLLKDGIDVLAIRRPGSPPAKQGRSVEASYEDLSKLRAIVSEEKPNYLFHVAGATKGVHYSDFERANVLPTENLVEACNASGHNLERFVLVSSLAAFGPSGLNWEHDESSEARPIEFYGRSKLAAERVLQEKGSDLPWTIVRPSGVYGPGDVDYFQLFKAVARRVNVFFGNRERLFSAVYVDDLIDALVQAAESPKSVGKGYFISDGKPVTWQHFQDEIIRAGKKRTLTLNLPEALVYVAAFGGEFLSRFDGKPRLFNRQKAAMGAQDAWTCSPSAAHRDFNFNPKISVPKGVELAFQWYQDQGWI